LLKGIKNLTNKLLRCSRFAKILEKKETLNSKPQKLGKMELLEIDFGNWSKSRNKTKIEP
jgi:hypothetical protein